MSSVVSSRRNSVVTLPPSPTCSQPPTPTSKTAPITPLTPSLRQRKLTQGSVGSNSSVNSSQRNVNPIRRCQSMRYHTKRSNSNGSNGTITSASLRSRRISSQPSSLEDSKFDNDFVKYYQYKTNRPDPGSFLNIVIADDLSAVKENLYRVLIMGTAGSGKSSLISQFSDHLEENKCIISKSVINNGSKTNGSSKSTRTCQDGSLVLHFREIMSLEECLPRSPIAIYQPDAYVVVYAINDRGSFEGAKELIQEVLKWDDVESKPLILVANKTDLVRSRTVSKQEGRQLAISSNSKYIETSCAISLNVDFLLSGIGAQINLKYPKKGGENRINRKPSFFKRLLKRAVKSKSCDNLNVL